MSTKVYMRDENGSIYSENRKIRYRIIIVENFDDYKKSEECIDKSFFCMCDSEGSEIAIEGDDAIIHGYIQEKRHSRYLKESRDELGIVEISGDTPIDTVDYSTIFDAIADESFYYEDLDDLLSVRMEFRKLNDEEKNLVKKLYCVKRHYSEKEIAKEMNKSQQAISYRKGLILDKINKNLKM